MFVVFVPVADADGAIIRSAAHLDERVVDEDRVVSVAVAFTEHHVAEIRDDGVADEVSGGHQRVIVPVDSDGSSLSVDPSFKGRGCCSEKIANGYDQVFGRVGAQARSGFFQAADRGLLGCVHQHETRGWGHDRTRAGD